MTAWIVCHQPGLPPADPVAGLARLTDDDWAVGVTRADPGVLTTVGSRTPVDRWWSGGRGSFLADPFWLPDGALLAERYRRSSRRGDIVRIDPLTGEHSVVDEVGHHRSYPFVLHHQGRTVVIPEQSSQPGVTMYEYVAGALRPLGSVLHHLRVLDPTVAMIGRWWWMWCADAAAGPWGGRGLVFRAPDLFGPWEQQAELDGVGVQRPGGTPFRVGSAWYRPVQDCRGGYGRRLIVRRIDVGGDYGEHDVALLTIEGGDRSAGLHTVAVGPDGQLAIDAKRLRPSIAAAGRAVRTRALRWTGRTR